MKTFTKYRDTPKYVTELARKNRAQPTEQEQKLWNEISGRKLAGLKFRRQFPVGRYIVDFYNHENRLVVEIDGPIHDSSVEYDRNRDAYLKGCGYKVLRVGNDEIDGNIESVLGRILLEIQQSPPAGEVPGG